MAATSKDAEAAFDAFIAAYQPKYDKAAECLAKDRQALLAFYDFPAEHWKHLRTSNPIESTFAPCGTAQSARRAASRTRRRLQWCSSWSMPPRKVGAGSIATTSRSRSFKVSGSQTGSKPPPTQHPQKLKPPPPDPSGHHQNSAIARFKGLRIRLKITPITLCLPDAIQHLPPCRQIGLASAA
jgi:hypothetical protein